MSDLTDPRPGFYRHYKGGFYRLLLVADHHEHDGRRVAIYLSLERGTINARQVAKVGPEDREDCWTDSVPRSGGEVPRFEALCGDVGPAVAESRLWPARVWLHRGNDPSMPAIECGASEPGSILYVRAESIPKDLDDALRQVEHERRIAEAHSTRCAGALPESLRDENLPFAISILADRYYGMARVKSALGLGDEADGADVLATVEALRRDSEQARRHADMLTAVAVRESLGTEPSYLPDDWDVHAKSDGVSGHPYIDAAVVKIAVLEDQIGPPAQDGPCPGCGAELGEIDNAHRWKDCATYLRAQLAKSQC